MAIVKKSKQREIVIDLTGPDGNVFVLMGYARRFARDLGLDSNKIINEMQSETQPDYTRGLIIGGVVFTALMLLLIWRIGK